VRKTRVRFLTEVDEEAGVSPTVLAVFPETESPGYVECYASLGQHGSAHPDYVKTLASAEKEAYWPLVRELASIGYDLEIENEQGPR